MTPAQRLARLPGCWRPGMRDDSHPRSRVVDVWPNGYPRRWVNEGEDGDRYTLGGNEARECWADCAPDLTDPATRGCLAEWAREVYGDPNLHATPTIGRTGWRIACGRGTTVTGRNGIYVEAADTEGDAWAAAILAKLENP